MGLFDAVVEYSVVVLPVIALLRQPPDLVLYHNKSLLEMYLPYFIGLIYDHVLFPTTTVTATPIAIHCIPTQVRQVVVLTIDPTVYL
jgi:hypothetical protein